MFKRKIAFFLNFFAFSITLALMVLPHHHHDGDVCILNAACHSDHNDDGDENESHNHDHSSCSNDHSCVLEQEIVFRSNNFENILKASESVDNRPGFDGICISPFGTSLSCFVPPVIARQQIGINSSMYSSFVNLSLGLRGPPTT